MEWSLINEPSSRVYPPEHVYEGLPGTANRMRPEGPAYPPNPLGGSAYPSPPMTVTRHGACSSGPRCPLVHQTTVHPRRQIGYGAARRMTTGRSPSIVLSLTGQCGVYQNRDIKTPTEQGVQALIGVLFPVESQAQRSARGSGPLTVPGTRRLSARVHPNR